MQREQGPDLHGVQELYVHAVVLGPSMHTFDSTSSYTSSKPSPVLRWLQGGLIAVFQATAASTEFLCSMGMRAREWHYSTRLTGTSAYAAPHLI